MAFKKSLDYIMTLPLAQTRLKLAGAVRAGQFDSAGMQAILDELKDNDRVKAELPKIAAALKTGEANQTPNLNFPETQLAWASVLTYLHLNPEARDNWPDMNKGEKLKETRLWRQLTGTRRAVRELTTSAYHIYESVRNPDTILSWGEPGTWFYFDPAKNRINMDFLNSLIGGFEHTRAVTMHEVGHSQLTTKWTPAMQKLRKEMVEISDRGKTRPLKKEEWVEMHLKRTEWHYRMQLFNAAEDNVVNRYAANLSELEGLPQDYSVSLNHISATLAGTGAIRQQIAQGMKKGDKPQNNLEAFQNLCHMINMSFFCNNELFEDKKAGWESVGVALGWIKTPHQQKDNPTTGMPKAFEKLRHLAGSLKGLEHLQPRPEDKLYGKAHMQMVTDQMADARNKIIDEIWEEYCEKLMEDVLEQAKKDLEEKADQQQNGQDQQPGDDQQPGEGEPGEGEPGEGQPGEGQPGEGQPGEGQPGDGQPSDGQPSDGQPSNGPPQPGEDTDAKVDVDGAGEMADIDRPPEDPQSAPGQDGEPGDDADADPNNPDGQSVGDIMDQDNQDEMGDEADGPGEEGDEPGQEGDQPGEGNGDGQGKGKGKGAGKGGDGGGLDNIKNGSWENYQQKIAALSVPIAQVTSLLKKIQDRQLQQATKISNSKRDLLPEAGEIMDRFDIDAHRELVKKRLTGQQVTEQDLERFRANTTSTKPTEIDLVILIDGSGSMNMRDGNAGSTRLEAALQSAAIMYEAARRRGVNVYIGMWGNNDPPMIAKPGDSPLQIGKAMESVRRGLNSGTSLNPAIKKTVKVLADAKGHGHKPSGMTHVMIISDGDIFDVKDSQKAIETLLTNVPQATVDVGIIGNGKTSLDKLADQVDPKHPVQAMTVVHEIDSSKITTGIVGMVLNKLRSRKSFAATTNYKKRRNLKKANKKMEPKP